MRHPFDGISSGDESAVSEKTDISRRSMLKKTAVLLAGAGALAAGGAFAGATTMAVGEEGGGGGGGGGGRRPTGPRPSTKKFRAMANKRIEKGYSLLKSGDFVLAYEIYDDLYCSRRRLDGGLRGKLSSFGNAVGKKAVELVNEAEKSPCVATIANCMEASKFKRLSVSEVAGKKSRALRSKQEIAKEVSLAHLEVKARAKYRKAQVLLDEIKSGSVEGSKKKQAEINVRYMLKSIARQYADTPTGKKAATELTKVTG